MIIQGKNLPSNHLGYYIRNLTVPEYDAVIRNGCNALKPGRRWVILDFKMPSGPLSLFAPLGIFLTRQFGVQKELAERHPWESIQKYMRNTWPVELYGWVCPYSRGRTGRHMLTGSFR